ncbi:hypothetical protein HKX48_005192 [Thoreauomyces humboldtii]|nr:hypothetical protein HKX48_005192 [Thoreauomyces humboldtii]
MPMLPQRHQACPDCRGEGYVGGAPCFACPGPVLTSTSRFHTIYDGMGLKGLSPASSKRSPSLPIFSADRSQRQQHPRKETRIWVDGTTLLSSATVSPSPSPSSPSDTTDNVKVTQSPTTQTPRPRWSLRSNWLPSQQVTANHSDADSEHSTTSSSTAFPQSSASASAIKIVQRITGRLNPPRRSKRKNARMEVILAEKTLRELAAKARVPEVQTV